MPLEASTLKVDVYPSFTTAAKLVRPVGLEPTVTGLKVRCFTIKLQAQVIDYQLFRLVGLAGLEPATCRL